MMDTDLGAAHAREKRLGVIRASAFVGIGPFVIDALRQKAVVERVPMRGFVGVNRGAQLDNGGDIGDAGRFGVENFGHGPAALLASDYSNLALAVLVFGQAPIAAVFLVVRRLHITAEIGAVDRDRTGYRLALFARERFADFVAENERGLILYVEVAAQLQRGMTFDAVHENRDGQQIGRGPGACGEAKIVPDRDTKIDARTLCI